jgi:hypothetical protein
MGTLDEWLEDHITVFVLKHREDLTGGSSFTAFLRQSLTATLHGMGVKPH